MSSAREYERFAISVFVTRTDRFLPVAQVLRTI